MGNDLSGGAAGTGSPEGNWPHGSELIEGTTCPACCFEGIVGECYEKLGPSKQCWHMMCCCPDVATVDIMGSHIICPELPGIDCAEKCCNLDVYDHLPWSMVYGAKYGNPCGGSGGGCWKTMGGAWLPTDDAATIAAEIAFMCSVISDTGCLSLCASQAPLCGCMRAFCDCDPNWMAEIVVLTGWRSRAGTRYNPATGRIWLQPEYSWRDILHELMHHCMYRLNLLNLESVAYACERACEPGYAGRKDADPCCCSANPPKRCSQGFEGAFQRGVRTIRGIWHVGLSIWDWIGGAAGGGWIDPITPPAL